MDPQFLLTFLKDHIERQKPLGLAYSGGPDSEALYQLFLEINQAYPLQLHVLHINHNWREESKKQADDLERKVCQDGFIFYRKDLEEPCINSNLEEKGRIARLQFFQEISEKNSLQGIFLAHHKDDLAETVLKKVLEGSHLINISSLKPVQKINKITLFRPLLGKTKLELKKYVSKKGISYVEDPTNLETRYTRVRIRHQILPKLSQDFGKSVFNNLVELSKRSEELLSYFKKTLPYPEKTSGPFGNAYDFNPLSLTHPLEWKVLLLLIIKEEKIVFSNRVLEDIMRSLQKKSANKKFKQNKIEIISDRGVLFVVKEKIHFPSKFTHLNEKDILWNSFKLAMNLIYEIDGEKKGWKSFWRADVSFYLPDGKYFLANFLDLSSKDKKQIQKEWSNQKIPAFLRKFPVIVSEDGHLIEDLLSYKTKKELIARFKVTFETTNQFVPNKKLKV